MSHRDFLEARAILPNPNTFHRMLLVVSTGEELGKWSSLHCFTNNPISYFVFKRVADNAVSKRLRWLCLDGKLQQIIDDNNEAALGLIEKIFKV